MFATIVITVGAILIVAAIVAGMALFPPPNFSGPSFVSASGPDADRDGIPDVADNCPYIFNPEQTDINHDGIGDVCASCPKIYTAEMSDTGRHGGGDFCDPDHDGIPNVLDNCPGVYNPDQADSSPGDGRGNACS